MLSWTQIKSQINGEYLMFISSVLLPIICCFFASCICGNDAESGTKTAPLSSPQFKILLRVTCTEIAVFLLCTAAIKLLMFHDSAGIPLDVMLTAAAVPFLIPIAEAKRNHAALRKFLRCISFCAMMVLCAEVLIFNMKSITASRTDVTVAAEQIEFDGGIAQEGDVYIVRSGGNLIIHDPPQGAHGLIMQMQQEQNAGSRRVRLELAMEDQSFRTEFQTVRMDYTIGTSGTHRFSFTPYEPLYALRISFINVAQPITVSAIRVTGAVPFAFSRLRFYLLFLICAAFSAIYNFKLYRLTVSENKLVYSISVNAMTMLCVLSGLLFRLPNQQPIEYIPGNDYSGSDSFIQVFDALQNDRADLNIQADPALEKLVNVYDRREREESGADYKWDFAYKDGKYYSYFGIGPVVAYYNPYHWLTGKLPTVEMAVQFFGIWAILFLCMAMRALVQLFMPDANLLMFLCMMPVSVGTAGIYYLLNTSGSYNIPLASGLCFLMLCIWLGVSACLTNQFRLRSACLIGSGAVLAMCAACRPGMAVGAAILIPLFLGILRRKNEPLKMRLTSAAVFTVPLIIGIIGILHYNDLRFGSPFDFGAKYQLTVSDIHANHLSIRMLPSTLLFYFFEQTCPLNTFPYFEVQYFDIFNYGKHVYTAPSVGAFAYPMLALGTLFLPFAVKAKQSGKASRLERNAVLLTCFVTVLLIAWMDFCMGGVIQRYTVDFLPPMTLGCCLTLLFAIGQQHNRKYKFIITGAALFVTFSMCWLLEMELGDGMLSRACPEMYDSAAALIQFWR